MQPYILHNYTPQIDLRIRELQQKCLRDCPDGSLYPDGFYESPGYQGGRNIICALDPSEGLLGYTAILPSMYSARLDARILYFDLRVDPTLPTAVSLKDILLEQAIQRARELKDELGETRAALSATYFARGTRSLEYLISRGFHHFESWYNMSRDLGKPVAPVNHPDKVKVIPWRMETRAERTEYLQTYEAVFGYRVWNSIEELQYFMTSPMWSVGTTFSAFDPQLVGSVMAYYDPDPQANPERKGATEHLFVVPAYRRRGVAGYLLSQALLFLQERGVSKAELQVNAEQTGAVRLYERLGYVLDQEEQSVGFML